MKREPIELDVQVCCEVALVLYPDGRCEVEGGALVDEPPFPFADEFAAWDSTHEDWRQKHEVLAFPGGMEALIAADGEVGRAFDALAGLRAIHRKFGLGDDHGDGGPSGADVCDALFALMTHVGLEVK